MIDKLEQERDFYRQQYNDLGTRLLRLQEEQSRARRDARRSRTAAKLIREVYRLVDSNISLDEIGQQFLQVILDRLDVYRAALLRYVPEQGCFVVYQALGFPKLETLNFSLPGGLPGDYHFINSNSGSEPLLDCLRQAAGVPYLLWSFNARAGLALLLGNLIEDQHLHRPFEADDREIVEGALGVFIEIIERKRAEEALQRANEELEVRVAERTAELTRANERLRLELAERKRAEQALRQSEERFRQVVTSISDHIYVTQLSEAGSHLNLYLSPHIEALTGYPYQKFVEDWSFWPEVVIHPDDQAAAAIQAARLGQGQDSEMEYRLIRADGEIIWVRDSGRVEWDEASRSLIVYGVVSDVTQRVRAEKELALARDQALEASRLKSQLLANVSHDLRTPLNAILGYTEMLQMGIYGPVSERQREMLGEVIMSTNQLLHFVNNLLDQAQIESGQVILKSTAFTPADLLEAVQSTLKVLARIKGLELSYDIAPDVPPTLWGSPYWLQRILVNLVANAIKFTEQGTVQVRVCRPDPAHWGLEVADTGPGIPVEARSYIFDAFRQVDGTVTRGHSGSGLGLSIVKQLTGLMGGRVDIISEVGHGSTFSVTLPLPQVQEESRGGKAVSLGYRR